MQTRAEGRESEVLGLNSLFHPVETTVLFCLQRLPIPQPGPAVLDCRTSTHREACAGGYGLRPLALSTGRGVLSAGNEIEPANNEHSRSLEGIGDLVPETFPTYPGMINSR